MNTTTEHVFASIKASVSMIYSRWGPWPCPFHTLISVLTGEEKQKQERTRKGEQRKMPCVDSAPGKHGGSQRWVPSTHHSQGCCCTHKRSQDFPCHEHQPAILPSAARLLPWIRSPAKPFVQNMLQDRTGYGKQVLKTTRAS